MIREQKLWGERWLLRQDSTHANSYLKLRAGTRCSWHRHREKYNLFVVLSGKVGIVTADGEVTLTVGQEFSVAPGVWHEFRAYEDSTMIEEMFVEYDDGDIERAKPGGDMETT